MSMPEPALPVHVDAETYTGVVAVPDDTETESRKHLRSGKIPRWRFLELERELATGEVRQSVLARKYGVSEAAITRFKRTHAARIDDIRAHIDDEFAGLWVASKANRIRFYEAQLERIEANDHHEWVKAKAALLKQIAEELGQLPPRQTVTVVPVVHILEGGVNTGDLT